ncbi:hypothetical protein [Caulobacter sp. FWC2]|uniref:hypothetical protein n=1 Tax=Caulobacter sp. FWC2 TaxID=69664 RepID=UPI000C14DA45|nr:hypothetical protein [Caulobacter sp. FWC2]PIB91295.1 hypothetical protein CSW62_06720 [Caulobacter sp. FWC2]
MADKVAPYGVSGMIAQGVVAAPKAASSDVGAKIAKAKQAGYSDQEIADFLGRDAAIGPKVAAARSAGYGAAEIVLHLAGQPSSGKAKALAEQRENYRRIRDIPVLGGFAEGQLAQGRGALFGWGDEIQGGVAAAATMARNALAPITGKPAGYTAKDAYDAARQASLEQEKDFAARKPVTNAVQQLAGGAWVPGGKYVEGAKTLGGAALRAAQVGAAAGAITGSGSADEGKRVPGAAQGALVGGVVGGAAPVLAKGGMAVAKRAWSAAREAGDRVVTGLGRDLPEPTAKQVAKGAEKGQEYVGNIVSRSKRALSGNEVESVGKPITAAEALGRTGISQLAATARRSGATGDNLEALLTARKEAAGERLLNDLSEVTGLSPDAALGDIEHIVKVGQQEAAPLFRAAFDAAPGPLQTEGLAQLSRRPVIKKALSTVAADMLNTGQDPQAAGFVVKGMTEGGLPDVVEVRGATAETWDAVRKAIGRQVERHPISNKPLPDAQSQGNYGIGVATRDLTTELKQAIPGYSEALDRSSDYLKADTAFKNAKKLMNPSVPVPMFRERYASLSDAEKQAHLAGFVNDTLEKAANGRLNLKALRTPATMQKLATMVGPAKARLLANRFAQEAEIAKTGSRMMPGAGSATMELSAADAEQKAAMGSLKGAARTLAEGRPIRAAIQAMTSPLVGAYRGAQVPIDQATRDEVGRLLQLSPSELDAVLKAAAARPRSPAVGRSTATTANALARGAAGLAAQN